MPLPNFLIIGAAKSGSTALYHHVRQHPQVFMPERKEPLFWGTEGHSRDWKGPDPGMNASITSMEEYQALFRGSEGFPAVGEATPYLGSITAPARIREHIPGARFVAVLRHPAERAFSSYCHMIREGFEPLSFEEGLEAEEERRAARWSPLFWYADLGYYGRDLKRWMEIFPREQFLVILYDDFTADPLGTCREVFSFLGVDPGFTPSLEKLNVSGVPRSRKLYDLFRKPNPIKEALKPLFPRSVRDLIQSQMRRHNMGPKPRLDPDTRRALTERFREDILLLQDLLGRDLSTWLRDPAVPERGRRAESTPASA